MCASYLPPSQSNGIYNTEYFINPLPTDTITEEYLQSNYLPSTGIAVSDATVTTFSGQINSIDSTNGTSSSGAIIATGGISITKDLYIGTAIISSNAVSATIFNNATNLSLGNITSGTISIGNLSTKDITLSTGNLMATTANGSLFSSATSITVGNITNGTVSIGNLSARNITSSTGILSTGSTTASIFNTATNLSIGSTSGTLTLNNSTVSVANVLNIANSLAINSSFSVFNSGANYLSGRIQCTMPLIGSLKIIVIECIQATSGTSGNWSVTYNFPTSFTYPSTGISYMRLTNFNSINDTNCIISGSNTSCTITVSQNSQSNNIFLIIGT